MNQSLLYSAIQSVGYTVLRFEDHPQFFGNWILDVKIDQTMYQFVADNREGWLMLFREKQGCAREKVSEADSHTFNEEQTIEKCIEWLTSEKAKHQ